MTRRQLGDRAPIVHIPEVPVEVASLRDAFVEHGFSISDCNIVPFIRCINAHATNEDDCPWYHAPVVRTVNEGGWAVPLANHPLVRCVSANATNYAELPRHTAIRAITIAQRVLGVVVTDWPTTANNR